MLGSHLYPRPISKEKLAAALKALNEMRARMTRCRRCNDLYYCNEKGLCVKCASIPSRETLDKQVTI